MIIYESEELLKSTAMLITWFKRLFVIAILCFIAFSAWFYRTFFNDPFDDWWFDEKIWKAQHNKSTSENPRGKMAVDLKNRIIKRGMTRKQVFQILGAPDFGQDERSFTYNLGYHGPFAMDATILSIDFDESGRVREVGWGQL